jgi:hypothetical protein
MRVARHAGIAPARRATFRARARNPGVRVGPAARVRTVRCDKTESQSVAPIPRPAPAAINSAIRPNIALTTACGCAPMASRIPISAPRRLTAYELTPYSPTAHNRRAITQRIREHRDNSLLCDRRVEILLRASEGESQSWIDITETSSKAAHQAGRTPVRAKTDTERRVRWSTRRPTARTAYTRSEALHREVIVRTRHQPLRRRWYMRHFHKESSRQGFGLQSSGCGRESHSRSQRVVRWTVSSLKIPSHLDVRAVRCEPARCHKIERGPPNRLHTPPSCIRLQTPPSCVGE